ncbi:DMT family transporter [Treponema pedis]|uniref:DMT family transporter n=1 Tax=Treponema pedis TaxID=409322 RepID=UPI00040DFC65|nr:DMT family transporter [Treponema pedis]
MNKNKAAGNAMLILTSFIWGTAFVAQRTGMDYVQPFTFMTGRYVLAFVSLGVVAAVIKLTEKKEKILAENEKPLCKIKRRNTVLSGLVTGFFLFLGSTFQQTGILYTTVGKAGFITSLYIVIVPLFGVFTGKKIRKLVWIGVVFEIIGLYLLTIKEGFSIGYGDLIIFASSFVWAGHVLSIDYFSKKVDPVYMSFLQFAFCSILSAAAMFIADTPVWSNITAGWFPIFYAGVFSAGIGYTLQMIAQKNTDPTIASLILSLEAVFGAIAGYYFLGEILSIKELLGCAVLFTAVIIAQFPEKSKK